VRVDPESQSIKERKNLRAKGYPEVTMMNTPKGNTHKNPIPAWRGRPVDDREDFIYGLEEEIEKTSKTFKKGSKQQEHNQREAKKKAGKKIPKERTGKKPFTKNKIKRN
jgi:hypothetical protein